MLKTINKICYLEPMTPQRLNDIRDMNMFIFQKSRRTDVIDELCHEVERCHELLIAMGHESMDER